MNSKRASMNSGSLPYRQPPRGRNNNLKNPTLLIRSVPIPGPGGGITEPNPKLFPRHADEFYSLRDASSEHSRRMLAYLAKFYDIGAQSAGSSGSDRAEVLLHIDPKRAVELLEDILGLREEHFIVFRERARLLTA